MARHMFSARIHDVNCGLRGFTRELYDRLELQCEGMEFAPEMIIGASLHGARIAEISITLHPEGRRTNAPYLRTVRDDWRTLRFSLIFSPRWLFLVPGFIFAFSLSGRLRRGVAEVTNRRCDIRCAHAFVFESCHSDGLPTCSIRNLRHQ